MKIIFLDFCQFQSRLIRMLRTIRDQIGFMEAVFSLCQSQRASGVIKEEPFLSLVIMVNIAEPGTDAGQLISTEGHC